VLAIDVSKSYADLQRQSATLDAILMVNLLPTRFTIE
jgi:hypothetical protein